MKLANEVSQLFKANAFNLVEIGVIATRLGIVDKKEEIHRRLYQQMFNEIPDEIDKAISVAEKSQLLATLDYIKNRISLRPEQREMKLLS